MIRLLISVSCSLAVPTLLIWAYLLWNKGIRRALLHWRNGAGLASVTFISASWLIQLFDLVLSPSHVNWQGSQNFEWYAGSIEIYLLPLAPLLALGLKGLPRLQVFTAGLLVWMLEASFVYV